MTWYVVVPLLKISGGNIEAIQLGREFAAAAGDARMLCMWRTQQPLTSELRVDHLIVRSISVRRAFLDFPSLFTRFRRVVTNAIAADRAAGFVFTHYATLPLALLVPRERRFYFVQDLEWHFIGSGPVSRLLRAIILCFYRRGRVLSANSYLTSALREHGVSIEAEVPIWANAAFLSPSAALRDIDFVMVLRTGAHKRLDLYRSFIELARKHPTLRLAVISPDDELIADFRDRVAVALLRPTLPQMRELYSRSKCFVHLSEHEGFGLPPLEAMGAGCVPLCRDSGGVRAFMSIAPVSSLLVPLDVPAEALFAKGQAVIASDKWQDLSDASRQIFLRGLDRTRGRAKELARIAVRP